jgi:hypothetical protein
METRMDIRPWARGVVTACMIGATSLALAQQFAGGPDPLRRAAESGNSRAIEPGSFAIDPNSPTTLPPGLQPYPDLPHATAANAPGAAAQPVNAAGAPPVAGRDAHPEELRSLATGPNGAVSSNELFARLDTAGTNRLTPAQVRSVPSLALCFAELDANRDGELDRTELADFDPLHPVPCRGGAATDVVGGPPTALP